MIDLSESPIVYVTRDIERALGLPLETEGYSIISNATPFAKQVAEGHANVILIESNELLDTRELLDHPKAAALIEHLNARVLVFKNTKQIERICEKNNWPLLNPKAELMNTVEEKLSQIAWLDELNKYLPPHHIQACEDVEFRGEPFILQFNRSHTGDGTMLIKSEDDLKELKTKFPKREVRITAYIEGYGLTNNNVVTQDDVLIGNISYQITGLEPFTDSPFATIGNDWALPHTLLSKKQRQQYNNIAIEIGNKLRKDGWKGLFGIDIMVEKDTGKLYLIEINARQPASTTYESQLQQTNTVFEAHLAALLDQKVNEVAAIDDGAQIILRNNANTSYDTKAIEQSLKDDFNIIAYPNTKPGTDLLRIQSKQGIMEAHSEFNDSGKNIVKAINA